MADAPTSTARVTLHCAAMADAVYAALLDDVRMFAALQSSGALGAPGTMLRAEIDPHVGGAFDFVDQQAGAEAVHHHGTYLTLARPTQIVFSWSVPAYGTHDEQVTIDLAADASGPDCVVTLTHVMAQHPPKIVAAAEAAWLALLAALAAQTTAPSSASAPTLPNA